MSKEKRSRCSQFIQAVIAGIVLLLVAVQSQAAQASTPPPPEQTARVEQSVLTALQTGGQTDYVLVFGDQADLSAAFQISNWNERGRYVLAALKSTAERSQARVIAELERRGQSYQSFISSNEIYVYAGDSHALQAVLSLPDVTRVRAPINVSLQPTSFRFRTYGPIAPQAELQGVVDWGITDSKADQFWNAYGRSGEGIIVANIDTGVDVTHPALSGAYRCAGGTLTDPACWFDPADVCAGRVCDNHGHGTHTMGTMVASNDPSLARIVGMAPGASWIACKGCEGNTCTEASLNACADWILAPGGDPANRPHVVNNSWGDEAGGDSWFVQKVSAWRAAGIFPAFAAGNNADPYLYPPKICSTLGSPGDYQESFSSAAHDYFRDIANFSSQGPGVYGDSPYTKPNISAPGYDIWSTIPRGSWWWMDGTSMASPHTAGAVALLWSCAPSLAGDIDGTFQLLQSSADPAPVGTCGAPASGEGNYTFGYGYLNTLTAGSGACTAGWIEGVVSDAVSGLPVEGAVIQVSHGILQPQSTSSSIDGTYSILMPQGTYSLSVSAVGFLPLTLEGVQVWDTQVTTINISLDRAKILLLPLVLNSSH